MASNGIKYTGGIGSPVPQEIAQVIAQREAIYHNPAKSGDEMRFLHESTPWIILRSGANKTDGGSDVSKGSPGEAKKYVLCGGHAIVGTGDQHFVEKSAPYLSPESTGGLLGLGYRPIPGITDVTLKSKDTWGMILEGTVNFIVSDQVTLDHIDKLYFKPGFPVLLEFGHTVYVTEEGRIRNTVDSVISHDSFFSVQEYDKIDKEVLKARSSNYNYEAVLGSITNYSWKIEKNGTYNCSITFVSKGTLLKGLKLKPVQTILESKKEGETQADADDLTSIYHVLISALNSLGHKEGTSSYADPGPGITETELFDRIVQKPVTLLNPGKTDKRWALSTKKALEKYIKKSKWKFRGGVTIPDLPVTHIVSEVGSRWFAKNPVGEMNYMQLRDIIYLIQTWNQEEADWFRFNYSCANSYVHATDCFSLNPAVAIKPFEESKKRQFSGYSSVNHYTVNEGYQIEGLDNSPNSPYRILNILVSLEEVANIIEATVGTKDEDYYVMDVIESLLSSIQKAFGNINDFGLHYNQDFDCFEIVDRQDVKRVDDLDAVPPPPSFRISGTKNTVKDFDIHSEVTDDMANMMSIAAHAHGSSGNPPEDGERPEPYVYWNEGMVSRFYFSGSKASGSKNWDDDIFQEKTERLYKILNGDTKDKKVKSALRDSKPQKDKDGNYSSYNFFTDIFTQIQVCGERLFKEKVNAEFQAVEGEGEVKKDGLSVAPIPYKAALTMRGIGGCVVGSTFKMDEYLLPSKFREWGNIITGIEHRIDKSGWWTTISSLYYPTLEAQKVGMARSSQVFSQAPDTVEEAVPGVKPPTYEDNEVDTCDLCEEFTKRFTWTTSQGWCALYTAAWADAWVNGKSSYAFAGNSKVGNSTTPTMGYAGKIGESFVPNMQAKGWTVVSRLSFPTSAQAGAWLQNTSFSPGDMVEMKSSGGHIHAQIFMGAGCGGSGKGWVSDWPQAGSWPYKTPAANMADSWVITYMQAPPKHPDWC